MEVRFKLYKVLYAELNMDFEKDLGLELLMNSKKKLPSDSISLSSRSYDDQAESEVAEPIDVKEHLTPPTRAESETTYDEEDEDDDEFPESEEASQPAPRYGGASAPFRQAASQRPSDEDIVNEKKEILYQFERLERKGYTLPRKFTLASSLEEMKMELERVKRDREIDSSVKFQRRMLMTVVTGVEFAADKFPGLGANLSGWSGTVNDELDEYDDIFVELHDKYKGKAKMAPELRLMGGLAGSAFMYHLTHKWSNSLPGLDTVLKQNPELAAKLAEATKSTMNQQQQSAGNFFSGLGGLGSMFGNMFGAGPPPPMPPDMAPSPHFKHPSPPSNKRMAGPSNVDDILSELNAMNENSRVEMMSTVSESEIVEDDISSINGLFMNKQGKGSIDLDMEL